MASRSSVFHTSLHRAKLIMGVERGMFAFIALFTSTCFAMKLYWVTPVAVLLYVVGRWLSKVDDQYVLVLSRYLQEEHVYDATPRPSDYNNRPKGWGRGLPR